MVERASIDESYLDVTGTLHLFGGDPVALAHEIRERIHRELGLTISVGVSWNKYFAKTRSDMKKPNAVTVITRENYRQKIWPIKIADMHMVGKRTVPVLVGMNIRTIGDLANCYLPTLQKKLGKHADYLYECAHGLDESPVDPNPAPPKSIGKHNTFRRDLTSRTEIKTGIMALGDYVAASLRREGFKCRTVQVTIKDPSLVVITRLRHRTTPSAKRSSGWSRRWTGYGSGLGRRASGRPGWRSMILGYRTGMGRWRNEKAALLQGAAGVKGGATVGRVVETKRGSGLGLSAYRIIF